MLVTILATLFVLVSNTFLLGRSFFKKSNSLVRVNLKLLAINFEIFLVAWLVYLSLSVTTPEIINFIPFSKVSSLLIVYLSTTTLALTFFLTGEIYRDLTSVLVLRHFYLIVNLIFLTYFLGEKTGFLNHLIQNPSIDFFKSFYAIQIIFFLTNSFLILKSNYSTEPKHQNQLLIRNGLLCLPAIVFLGFQVFLPIHYKNGLWLSTLIIFISSYLWILNEFTKDHNPFKALIKKLNKGLLPINEALIFMDLKGQIQFTNFSARSLFPNFKLQTSVTDYFPFLNQACLLSVGPQDKKTYDLKQLNQYFLLSLSRLTFNREFIGYQAMVVDASSLVLAKLEAENANKAKSNFLMKISHEIRNPLNAILGFSEILEQHQNLGSENSLRHIKQEAHYLKELVGTLLEFSEIVRGKNKPSYTIFDLKETLLDIVSVMVPRFLGKGITLTSEISTDCPHQVFGDPKSLKQILFNFLENAYKFTASGRVILKESGSFSKTFSASGEKKYMAFFEVIDEGIGVPEFKRPFLFTDYSQETFTKVPEEGHGLGLLISKELSEALGGSVHYSDRPSGGSIFSLNLPYKLLPQSAVSFKNESLAPQEEIVHQGHILIAEDHLANRELTRLLVSHWGFTCDEAENGMIALGLYKKNHYDLLLADVHMPVMNGLELAFQIRELEKNSKSHLPIIALTGHAASALEIDSHYIDDFLIKPIASSSLKNQLDKWMKAKKFS